MSLFSRPSPPTTPTASQRRRIGTASSRTINHRTSAQREQIEVRRGVEVAEASRPGCRDRGESCARRAPPRSRHMHATMITARHLDYQQQADRVGENPTTPPTAADRSGVIGGWSTYPNAGCRPATT